MSKRVCLCSLRTSRVSFSGRMSMNGQFFALCFKCCCTHAAHWVCKCVRRPVFLWNNIFFGNNTEVIFCCCCANFFTLLSKYANEPEFLFVRAFQTKRDPTQNKSEIQYKSNDTNKMKSRSPKSRWLLKSRANFFGGYFAWF